ncbi:MAG: YbhB/YbcL family Raf kinase inhibitor-like protein [Haloarculaceae archaeon]
MAALQLTSPAFEDGEAIPRKYGYEEDDVNPPLSIAGVPEGAGTLALIVDDPDAREPAGKIWDHWVVWNLPADLTEIPEDYAPSGDEAVEGQNDYGERGYGGPNPPDREHTYRFRLFALETALDLADSADAEALESAMDGEILVETTLTGTYAP